MCVTVARQTLTLKIGVRFPVSQLLIKFSLLVNLLHKIDNLCNKITKNERFSRDFSHFSLIIIHLLSYFLLTGGNFPLKLQYARVAQLVEHTTFNRSVGSSILLTRTNIKIHYRKEFSNERTNEYRNTYGNYINKDKV